MSDSRVRAISGDECVFGEKGEATAILQQLERMRSSLWPVIGWSTLNRYVVQCYAHEQEYPRSKNLYLRDKAA